MNFFIGQTVYHRDVYEHREPLEVVGICKDKLLLEGDYSGGTAGFKQQSWMPIKGVSLVYNHAYKKRCRDSAIVIEELAKPVDRNADTMTRTMFDLLDMVFQLTKDVSYNPEY
jgi:hypothetical protein